MLNDGFNFLQVALLHDRATTLAMGFVTPALFLAGVGAIAIPIVIHLLNRRRFKTVSWAAMDFLLRAMRKNRRRIRFEQWLLLALRCLLLVLAGLALARPIGCHQSTVAAVAGQRSGLHVIVIDNSFSMAYQSDRPNARTHLDHAKNLAKAQIDRLSGGSESVALILASAPASAALPKPTYDLEAAKNAVDRVEQSFSGTDLLGALRLADDVTRDSTQASKFLSIYSDSTRSAWETANADAVRSTFTDLAARCRITHFNLARPNQWNQAAVDLAPASRLVTRLSHDFSATVRGYGSGSDPTVQWQVDESSVGNVSTISVDANTPPLMQSQIAFKAGGPHVVSIRLTGEDRLPVDDSRWRVVDVATELKVLIVEGERGTSALGGSAAFLALALAPPREASSPRDLSTGATSATGSYVNPEVISDLDLGSRVLSDFRCVILVGVAQVDTTLADELRRFVDAGGTLMVFMGEPVNADNYNQVLLPRKLLPGRLARRMSVSGDQSGFTFDFRPDVVHPFLSIFRNQQNSGLDTAQVFTYWQAEVPPDANIDHILDYKPVQRAGEGIGEATRQADPAITSHAVGAGQVIFFSTTAGPEWTTLPAKPAFLTLIHELLSNSVTASDGWLNLQVGDALRIPPTIKLPAAPLLYDPSQQALTMETVAGSAGASFQSAPLVKPGVYTMVSGGKRFPVAVNLPADESDIRALDTPALKSAIGDADVDMLDDALPPPAVDASDQTDFGWTIMLAVLAIAGIECLLAMRFGHYRK